MFGDHAGVNDERAGDAVEICLAILYFATLYPYEFCSWGDPQENYGIEHSLRSFAAIAGRIETCRSQRGALGAELSEQVLNTAKSFAKVLGHPALVVTVEGYNFTLNFMRTGPIEALLM